MRQPCLSLLFLAACASNPERPSTSPTGASEDWTAQVSARIEAEARAITWREGAFVADLPATGLAARFDEEGVAVSDADGELLGLNTLAWGRAGSLEPVGPRSPQLGACLDELDPQGQCIERLELESPGLTEWWVGLGDGLEQGWTVARAPAGEGPLLLEVGVEGALYLALEEDGAALTDASGREWSVSGVRAWDADGVALPARLALTEGGLVVEVEDALATYPIEVDPVYTTASTTLSTPGEWGYEYFGCSVASAGDVNGDGYDDVIIGSRNIGFGSGAAYIYHGSSSGISSTADVTITGASYNYFGTSVSGAGDVNGDGYDDIIVGERAWGTRSGKAYVYHGSSSSIWPVADTTLTDSGSGTYFGYSASGAGDVNGDGYDDVIVGAYATSSSAGAAFVYHGSASGVSSTVSTTLGGAASSSYFGFSVSGAGDVNGDGYDDVIVGAHGTSSSAGSATVYPGSSSGVSTTAATTLSGSASSELGYAVSGAGDVNADGYGDVIVGARAYSTATGQATVYHGSSSGLSSTASTTLSGDLTYSYFGLSVSDAGDVDGDGYGDVVVGTTQGTGQARVYTGSASGISSSIDSRIQGPTANSGFSSAVSGAGDVNGDGYDDLIVGAFEYRTSTRYTRQGRAYLYLGY